MKMVPIYWLVVSLSLCLQSYSAVAQPSPSSSPSASPSTSPSASPSASTSPSPSASATPPASASASPSASASASASPSASASASPSASPTASPVGEYKVTAHFSFTPKSGNFNAQVSIDPALQQECVLNFLAKPRGSKRLVESFTVNEGSEDFSFTAQYRRRVRPRSDAKKQVVRLRYILNCTERASSNIFKLAPKVRLRRSQTLRKWSKRFLKRLTLLE